jgi:hypothetical protein
MTTFTEPTTLPKLAGEDTANIAAPIVGLQDDGWADQDIPTAKNWNWFSHWVYKWVKYFQEALAAVIPVESGAFDITLVGNGAGTISVEYIKFANGTVTLTIPGCSSSSDTGVNTLSASGTPVPASIRPSGNSYTKYAMIPVTLILGGITFSAGAYPGALFILDTGAIFFSRLYSDAGPTGMRYKEDYFPSDASDKKGWYHIVGTYKMSA